MPTCSSSSIARRRAVFVSMPSCFLSVSMIWKPMVKHGFRLVLGSWKIIAMSLPVRCGVRDRTWQQVAPVEDEAVGRDPAGIGDEPHQREHGH
jgi:hypothetical protein